VIERAALWISTSAIIAVRREITIVQNSPAAVSGFAVVSRMIPPEPARSINLAEAVHNAIRVRVVIRMRMGSWVSSEEFLARRLISSTAVVRQRLQVQRMSMILIGSGSKRAVTTDKAAAVKMKSARARSGCGGRGSVLEKFCCIILRLRLLTVYAIYRILQALSGVF